MTLGDSGRLLDRGLLDGVGLRQMSFPFGQFQNFAESLVEAVETFLGQGFDIDEPVARPFECRDHLVQFQVDGLRVLVLRPLDEEHHQERDDRRAGVDGELPGVGVSEERAGD